MLADSDLDQDRMYFLATAGLIMAGADNEIDKLEYEGLIANLSDFTPFPENLVKDIIDSEAVGKIFEKSVQKILDKCPSEKEQMFDFMISIAFFDRLIKEEEVVLLFGIGQKVFGYSKTEVALLIAKGVYHNFIPKSV